MSGTIPLSMTQQFDVYGKPLGGGQLFIIQAGTISTPQDAFQDTGLTIKQPYPMTLDAAGRVPQFFLADGTVAIRLQDKSGVVQLTSPSVLVIGPSAGGGGGGVSVDPTALIQTGNMVLRYGVGQFPGYVRMNGLSVGSATSGATERANADAQPLFLYLWGTDPNLVVSSGRGASASADWTANKQIALPDWRGYAAAGLDDMGNAAAGRLTAAFFGTAATVLGAAGGSQSYALAVANLPPYTPAGVITNGTITATTTAPPLAGNNNNNGGGGGAFSATGNGNAGITVTQQPSTFAGTAQGGTDTPFALVGPTKLCTFYLKL